MKDDVEIPPAPPRKRRELERALPQWLAVWANDESLPPSQRARAQAERDRRKKHELLVIVRAGVIVGEEGMTPAQADTLVELVMAAKPIEFNVCAPRLRHLRRLLAAAGAEALAGNAIPLTTHDTDAELVKASTTLFAAPKETEKPAVVQGVWEAVRYARHRRLPVTVVMPDGEKG